MKRMLIIVGSIILGVLFILAIEVFIASLGPKEIFKNPDRSIRASGTSGHELKYLVMGDSTAAGQGANYEQGYAVKTMQHLEKKYNVLMLNTGISGAKIQDVLEDQVKVAEEFNPDVIVIAVGANDTIRLTSDRKIRSGTTEILDRVIKANCNAKIVVTGSADMGTVLRFYPPLNWLATWRSKQVTKIMKEIIDDKQLTYAPIFEEVGPPFRQDHSLFSADKFHPNERGYVIWSNVLNTALDEALMTQKSHCKSR